MRSKSRGSSLRRKRQVLSNIKEVESNKNLDVESCSAQRCGGNLSKVNTELERTKVLITKC